MMDKFTTMEQVEAYTAGEQIQCLECNKWFAFLGNHLRRAHGLSNDEYRERYALPAMTPLAGQAYRRAHREKLQRMQADGTIDYLHLPAATEKAAAAAKPKIGVAKIQHANLIAQLRPGDHHKLTRAANAPMVETLITNARCSNCGARQRPPLRQAHFRRSYTRIALNQ